MFLKTALSIIAFSLLSCGAAENQTQTSSNSETTSTASETAAETTSTTTDTDTLNPQQLMADGYLLGIIVYSDKDGDCPYTIQMPGDKMEFYYLDPVNLDEKYKKDGQKVWIKFNGLRRMNRCDKATPAEITAIRKGE